MSSIEYWNNDAERLAFVNEITGMDASLNRQTIRSFYDMKTALQSNQRPDVDECIVFCQEQRAAVERLFLETRCTKFVE